ncbi:MAG: Gfo/Idh/MocA family oxidoreductase [Clostridia bacterium]|nr:Gfo/Idh/MocA family oxidoreductase [Clostridia bacterium]
MDKIRIGVIGAGSMGKNHIRVYKDLYSECELIGFHDIDEASAQKTSAIFAVEYYKDLKKMLNDADAVSIAVPTKFHKTYGILCAKQQKHILMEKPIALDTREAMDLIEACNNNGVILQIGHIERFNPAISELSNILKNETLISLDFQRLSPFDKRINDTDVVKDLMIHDIDIMNLLIKSEVDTLYAHGACVFSPDYADYAQTLIKLKDHTLVSTTASRVTEDKVRSLCVNTKNARIYVDYINKSINISRRTNFKLDTGYDIAYKQENIIEKVYVQPHEPLKSELLSFIKCIKSGQIPCVTGYDGLKALALAEKICEAIYPQNSYGLIH